MRDLNDPSQPESSEPESNEAQPAAAQPAAAEPAAGPEGDNERTKRSLARRITYWSIGLVGLAVLAYAGFYGYILYRANHDIRQSTALGNVARPTGQGMDLLLMGLDSRKDENGNDLPEAVYKALHAGTAADGGNNSNALMYIHISNDGTKAVAISIPRDDWVEIANCKTDSALRQYVPSGCMGKIKSAYGWALAAAQAQGKSWEQAKDIARAEEVQTVMQFLHVKISSFVEVTMGAFYEIAQQVGKVEVCVKENTTDSFSGADFKQGHQWLSPTQTVAFVRQRRDLNGRYDFTDLDRSRRQQAFIVSLLTQMKSAGTLLNPITLNNIVNVATSNVVISKGLNPISVAKIAANLSGGNLHFYTLPIVTDTFWPSGHENVGEVANQVDLTEIRSIVADLIHPPAPAPTPTTPAPSGHGSGTPTPSPTAVQTVSAEGGGLNGPATNQLSDLTGSGIPCVK